MDACSKRFGRHDGVSECGVNQGCNNIGTLCICGAQGFSCLEQAARMVEFQAYCCRKTYAMEDIRPGHEGEMALMVDFLMFRCMKTYSAGLFTAAEAELNRRVSP